MPKLKTPYPVLQSFRVLAFDGQNKGEAVGAEVDLTVEQGMEVGLSVPTVPGAPLMASVLIALRATGTRQDEAVEGVSFAGQYEAKFFYSVEVTEDKVAPMLEDRDYQYVLVAQAFPLAMTHFRRELQAMGLDARALPLGLES